jgi:cytochrome P450
MDKHGKASKSETGENILSNLVKHSVHIWDGPKEQALQDDELIGNAYVFLVAGHETT